MMLVRSILFNLVFYGATAVACVLCLPGLLLPKPQAMLIVRAFVGTVYFLERHILKLDFEVRGRENLPAGSFIVAAKHQSAYETMKLHILFDDPAIILKQELLSIPLWGRFLAKTEPIAIDRSRGRDSILQVIEGTRRVQAQGRPIVVFPQGTRVKVTDTVKEKPYRNGVMRMREATGMKVIPLALNTGVFWPRGSWRKRSGRVIFEFLPPVETLEELQNVLETRSKALEGEAA